MIRNIRVLDFPDYSYKFSVVKVLAPEELKSLEKKLYSIARSAAGARYSEEVNVELPLAAVFDGFGKTKQFFDRYKVLKLNLRKEHGSIDPTLNFEKKLKSKITLFFKTTQLLIEELNKIPENANGEINLLLANKLATKARKTYYKFQSELYRIYDSEPDRNAPQKTEAGQYHASKRERIGFLITRLQTSTSTCNDIISLIESNETLAAQNNWLWLNGDAGTGKTHLLCDIAKARIKQSLPTVLFMGQQLSSQTSIWSQLNEHLGIIGDKKEFIKFIRNHYEHNSHRVLIIIDAINEGDGIDIWPNNLNQFVSELTSITNIAVVTSCRTSYENALLAKTKLKNKPLKITHRGFSGSLISAVVRYFKHYGIKTHEIPLISEFSNPLFLKTYCRSLKKYQKKSPMVGQRGMRSTIENFYLSVDADIRKKLGYSHNLRAAWEAAKEVAKHMAVKKTDWLERNEVKDIIKDFQKTKGIKGNFYLQLVKEDLLAEDMRSIQSNQQINIVRFPFQKFSDHLIVLQLLNEHFDKTNPKKCFEKDGALFWVVNIPFRYSGLIEAFSIQIPERTNCELIDLIDDPFEYPYPDAFLESLIWRDPQHFHDIKKVIKTLNFLGNSSSHTNSKIFSTILSVATIPNHPFNAEFLHKVLLKKKMPQRDSWWGNFIHYAYSDKESVIERLLLWGRSAATDIELDPASARLAAITLTWLFTTSHRFLRDRATKSLTALLSAHPKIVPELLNSFFKIDDLYVVERLFAATYGCIIRCTDKQATAEIAKTTYNLVFKNKTPPLNALLREYAKGIIEFSNFHQITPELKNVQLLPPFKSRWPNRLPTLKTLERRYERKKDGDYSRREIYNSVSGHGDFGIYVLGRNHTTHWLAEKLHDKTLTPKEQIADFRKTLQKRGGKTLFDNLKRLLPYYSAAREISFESSEEIPKDRIKIAKHLAKTIRNFEIQFLSQLSKDQLKQYKKNIRQLLEDSKPKRENFPVEYLQRYILTRVLQMGWHEELHAKIDGSINRPNYSRSASKPERIGKKYQWLAYYEALAILSDNHKFSEHHYQESNETYKGLWQIHRRDIDPTSLLEGGIADKINDPSLDFSHCEYDDWELTSKSDVEWLQKENDIPKAENLIQVDINRQHWLNLKTALNWDQPIPADEDQYELNRRNMWIHVDSVFVKRKDKEKVLKWLSTCKTEDLGYHFSDSGHVGCFLGEMYWANNYWRLQWDKDLFKKGDVPAVLTVEAFYDEHGNYDCSKRESVRLLCPNATLIEALGLQSPSFDGRYFDKKNDLVFFDTRILNIKSSAMIKKETLIEFLDKNELEVIWIIEGKKQIYAKGHSYEDWPGDLSFFGHAYLKDGKISALLKTTFSPPRIKDK